MGLFLIPMMGIMWQQLCNDMQLEFGDYYILFIVSIL